MSIEGPGIYQDDNGHDVRSEFRELIGEGRTPHDATRALLNRWADVLGDEDTYCAFYLALADTQWRLGRPIQAVQDAALSIIDSGPCAVHGGGRRRIPSGRCRGRREQQPAGRSRAIDGLGRRVASFCLIRAARPALNGERAAVRIDAVPRRGFANKAVRASDAEVACSGSSTPRPYGGMQHRLLGREPRLAVEIGSAAPLGQGVKRGGEIRPLSLLQVCLLR